MRLTSNWDPYHLDLCIFVHAVKIPGLFFSAAFASVFLMHFMLCPFLGYLIYNLVGFCKGNRTSMSLSVAINLYSRNKLGFFPKIEPEDVGLTCKQG